MTDAFGNEHRKVGNAEVIIGAYQHPTRYDGITSQTVTVNHRSTWGSMLRCAHCGTEQLSLSGSSVSYEDGPMHFSRHECKS